MRSEFGKQSDTIRFYKRLIGAKARRRLYARGEAGARLKSAMAQLDAMDTAGVSPSDFGKLGRENFEVVISELKEAYAAALVAYNFKGIRETLQINQEEAANRVGCSRSTWQDWESGRREPNKIMRGPLNKLEGDANKIERASH